MESAAVTASQQRAVAAADAAAHAAEVVLAEHPRSAQLSVELQSGESRCVFPEPAGATGPVRPDPSASSGTLFADPCQVAFAVAREESQRNGAQLSFFVVGPDLRDRAPGAGAGRLQVVVRIARPRRLPGSSWLGPLVTSAGICQVEAESAAEAE
jgi:hypothetical protein